MITADLPGRRRFDIFSKPDLQSNESVDEPVDPLSKQRGADLTPSEFILRATDLPLVSSLNALTKPEVTYQGQLFSLITSAAIPQALLSTIQLYPSEYTGRVTPETINSCQIVAGKLTDTYNLDTRRFNRQRFLENDYLGIIAQEAREGRTLVAFDRSLVLQGLANYIRENSTYDVIRTEALREEVLKLNPVVTPDGVPYIEWESRADLAPAQPVPRGPESVLRTPAPFSSLRIYSFYDSGVTTANGDLTELYMIFAPVSADEVLRITLYLNRNVKMYSFKATIAVRHLFPALGRDFEYLFPVTLSYLVDYTVISSEHFDSEGLEHLYLYQEVLFPMTRVDELRGVYAAYLLSEALYYEFSIRWERGTLIVGLAGHIQARDISEQFSRILTELNRERLLFTPIPNFEAAVNLCLTSDVKCFYYHGRYYAVTTTQTASETSASTLPLPDLATTSLIELKNPLRAVVDPQISGPAKQYLALLGYETSPNPVPYRNELQLGYRTYLSQEKTFTAYYYTSTSKSDIEIHEIDGPDNEEVRNQLEGLLQRGYFSTQRFRNLTRGYPGFIPSDSPVRRGLSRNPTSLITELENLEA